jgi:hypothetical protein
MQPAEAAAGKIRTLEDHAAQVRSQSHVWRMKITEPCLTGNFMAHNEDVTMKRCSMTTFCGILTGVRLSIRSLIFPLAMAAMIILRTHPAAAELVIDITRGNIDPLPIAVTSFLGEASREAQIGKDISAVLSADLERSGLFRPIPHKAFIQTGTSLAVRPRFGDWRIINAQAMVQGRIEIQDSGKLRIEFRLWDVFAEQQMAGQAYFTVAKNWRRVAHIIADVIYKRMTGESGYFDTRCGLYRGKRPRQQAHQAAGHHGPGWCKPPFPHRRPVSCSNPAFFTHGTGNHLPFLYRQRAAGVYF